MAKYAIDVREVWMYQVQVEADNYNEAIDKVYEKIDNFETPKDISEYCYDYTVDDDEWTIRTDNRNEYMYYTSVSDTFHKL